MGSNKKGNKKNQKPQAKHPQPVNKPKPEQKFEEVRKDIEQEKAGLLTNVWFLEPQDVLAIGDGRAIEDPGRKSLFLPFPSSLVGLVRTKLGSNNDGIWNRKKDDLEDLLKVMIQGPCLVNFLNNTRLWPAPMDAIFNCEESEKNKNTPSKKEDENILIRSRIAPEPLKEGTNSDLTYELLHPIKALPKGKAKKGPIYWKEAELIKWLVEPIDRQKLNITNLGFTEIVREPRTHVAIDPKTQTAKEGMLFRIDYLRYRDLKDSFGIGFKIIEESLTPEKQRHLAPEPAVLGGERRMVHLKPGTDWWEYPEELSEKLVGKKRLRIFLLTPAFFEEGAIPSNIFGAKVVAAAVDRPQTISGWDYKIGKPKPSRRFAPAGSIYWVEPDEQNLASWAKSHWMDSVCKGQDKNDGFGLCVVGVA